MIHRLFFIDQETKNSKQRAKQRRKTLKSQIGPPLIPVFRIKSAKQFITLCVIPNCPGGFCFIVRWNQLDYKRRQLELD